MLKIPSIPNSEATKIQYDNKEAYATDVLTQFQETGASMKENVSALPLTFPLNDQAGDIRREAYGMKDFIADDVSMQTAETTVELRNTVSGANRTELDDFLGSGWHVDEDGLVKIYEFEEGGSGEETITTVMARFVNLENSTESSTEEPVLRITRYNEEGYTDLQIQRHQAEDGSWQFQTIANGFNSEDGLWRGDVSYNSDLDWTECTLSTLDISDGQLVQDPDNTRTRAANLPPAARLINDTIAGGLTKQVFALGRERS